MSILEKLRPREADHEQRHLGRAVAQVFDQVEQRRLGPVHVVEHEHGRPFRGERLQQPTHCPVRLAERARPPRLATQLADSPRDELVPGQVGIDAV